MKPMPTIAEAITQGSHTLDAAGIDQALLTAGLLLRFVLGVDRTYLLTRADEEIDQTRYRRYLSLIDRRAAGEPAQYLIGYQEFYGLNFVVSPDVLIPRPETEFLVERVLKLVSEGELDSPMIVDVGTGSGCIAVTLAVKLQRARVIATDVSGSALQIASTNAADHGVTDRIEFLEGDLLDPLDSRFLESVDIVASNPPYVEERGRDELQREVRDWEPQSALFGGTDGLDFYRRLVVEARKYLTPGGHLVLEVGYGQLDAIASMLPGLGWEVVDVTRDLQDVPRVLTLEKNV
jgi:release factor glutamine methyltransferase